MEAAFASSRKLEFPASVTEALRNSGEIPKQFKCFGYLVLWIRIYIGSGHRAKAPRVLYLNSRIWSWNLNRLLYVQCIRVRIFYGYRLIMELDLQSLFARHVLSCTYWLRPPPPELGSYTRELLVSQDRRHLFVTPCLWWIRILLICITGTGFFTVVYLTFEQAPHLFQ